MAGISALFPAASRRLEGKVALITGAASGLGACAARLFAAHGAKVVIADVQDDLGRSVVDELNNTLLSSSSSSNTSSSTYISSYVHCDVTNESHVRAAVDSTVSAHGKLDIMFNNAGTSEVVLGSIIDESAKEFERVLRVNLMGPFLGTKHAARVMIPKGAGGSIINMASVCSVMGGAASHGYTSSKHGLLGLTRNTAVQLGRHGIRVNCVSPYLVVTPMVEKFVDVNGKDGLLFESSNLKGKMCKPEDVAEAALYLATDNSRFTTGANLIVDGGFTIMNPSLSVFH